MNAGDEAIEEIRAVRRRISAEHGHDITQYLATLREEEKLRAVQIQCGEELLARRQAYRKNGILVHHTEQAISSEDVARALER